MTVIVSHKAIKLFTDQAVTLSVRGDIVTIQCDTPEEAVDVLDLLESLVRLLPVTGKECSKFLNGLDPIDD